MSEVVVPQEKIESKSRVRLDFLDGLRGMAALYVVLFHAQLALTWPGTQPPELAVLASKWMKFGRFAVSVFIVLSGYCLMLPVVRSANGRLSGGFRNYIKRRSRRILPPYFAALVISLSIIALIPGMNFKAADYRVGCWWDHALPAFTPSVLISHLFLFHNLSPDWHLKINGSMWSVATEWQIYFLFPALLLPVWRRLGIIAMLAAAFAVGISLHYVPHSWLPGNIRFDENAAPWFLGLFALGMAGAVVGFSRQPRLVRLRTSMPWGTLAAVFTCVFLGVGVMNVYWLLVDGLWQMDIVVGIATVCLIVFCARHLTDRSDRPKPDLLHILEMPQAVALGTFSYSLYLMHAPTLGILHLVMRHMKLSAWTMYVGFIVIGVLLSLVVSYLFHLVFEKRFMPAHAQARKEETERRALSPAP